MKKYRLYIDESGTHHYSNSDGVKERYLSLTGVIVSETQNIEKLQPEITKIKKLFQTDPDLTPTLHREDIISAKGVFSVLNDPEIKKKYENLFIELIRTLDFTLCCVVLDKKEHLSKYEKSAYHPYNYCFSILLERYTHFLEMNGGNGDVMIEARGKKEDRILKEEYNKFFNFGTSFRSKEYVQSVLTSKDLKIKCKSDNIAGLEFADLLSMPSKLDVLYSFNKFHDLDENFTKIIVETIQCKYFKNSYNKKILGHGKKII